MVDRYDWERERDRERGREQGRDPGYERYGEFRRNDWDMDRERRYTVNEDRYGEGWPVQGRYEDPSRDYRGREEFNRGRSWQDENRAYESRPYESRPFESRPYENRAYMMPPERRADYGDRGDWGRQGSWGSFGNRPDFHREGNQREDRNPEGNLYNNRNDWRGAGSYGGGMGSYSGGIPMGGARGHFTGRGPKGWTRSDERIREDVSERLSDHPHIDASEIEVQVKNAEVTLIGSVDDRWTKHLAEDLAENVGGVKEVHNQLKVQSYYAGQEQQSGNKMMASSTGTAGGTKRT